MVDADQEAVLEARKPRAVNAVTLQNNGGLVISLGRVRLDHLIRERQRAVDARHRIVQHYIGLLAHGAQQLTAGQS